VDRRDWTRAARRRGSCGTGRRRVALNRGAIYDVEFPFGRHPVVILTRDRAIPVLSQIIVALITSTVRDVPTEVAVGPAQGLTRACVVNCDNLFTIPKSALGRRRGELDAMQRRELRQALAVALELD
jgi:mRNA interferase MazF